MQPICQEPNMSIQHNDESQRPCVSSEPVPFKEEPRLWIIPQITRSSCDLDQNGNQASISNFKMKSIRIILSAVAPAFAAFTFENVHIGGGGGFVPSIVFHPTEEGLAYARTDIGGIYKLNSDDSWTPITDGIADNDNWLDSHMKLQMK
jgi:hypothetical protein